MKYVRNKEKIHEHHISITPIKSNNESLGDTHPYNLVR
jgi:hypothetical protein